MRLVLSALVVFLLVYLHDGKYTAERRIAFRNKALQEAILDMLLAMPSRYICTVVKLGYSDSFHVNSIVFKNKILVEAMLIDDSVGSNTMILQHIRNKAELFQYAVYLIYLPPDDMENIMIQIASDNLSRRSITYIFYWENHKITRRFTDAVHESLRVVLITDARIGTYQIFYNVARPNGLNELVRTNWWSIKNGLFHSPLLPTEKAVFQDFKKRKLLIPVLHKPPWFFVKYTNETFEVEGGRDDKLLQLIANKLNFDYEYIDPPEKSQGSALVNGTMPGVLGLLWKKKVDLFLGDISVTYERSIAVEFTFFTVADSEAFITHSPGKLNEALALIRPFHWQVWPPVIATICLSGPILYIFVRNSRNIDEITKKTFSNLQFCVWLTTTIFLKQSISVRISGTRIRIFIAALFLVSTYIIGDMYSANLTSMLARPARERPITTLEELQKAMQFKDYKLLVEKNSASHAILENGTGLYKKIWDLMKLQPRFLVNSTENGMQLVKTNKYVAMIGGRETFYYDMRRFGLQYFHLSEKLYTRYSAIALQLGCPYTEIINSIIKQLYEAGILTKITEEEYQKLKEKQRSQNATVANSNNSGGKDKTESESDTGLTAISMTTLQGAFYVLISGNIIAGFFLMGELIQFKKAKTNDT